MAIQRRAAQWPAGIMQDTLHYTAHVRRATEVAVAMHGFQRDLNLYAILVENSLGLMCVHDLQGTLLAINPAVANSLGYPIEEGLGRNLKTFLAPSVQHLFQSYLHRIRENGTDSGLMRLVARDGSERIWMYRNILYETAESPPQVLGHALDLTDRVMAEQALKRAQKELRTARDELAIRVAGRTKELQETNERLRREIEWRIATEEALLQARKLEALGVFAGGIAHDFNNVLTGVMGNASFALELISPSSPAREPLERVVQATQRAAELTRQLLACAGKGRFIVEPVNLSDLVREMSHVLQASIPKNTHLQLDIEPNLPPVEADAEQLQRVVMNLVINGAEAIADGESGTVSVRTGVQQVDHDYVRQHFAAGELRPGCHAFLEVHDTGAGMDEATKARVFDPFFTTKFTGRGLGLAAVRGIVQLHKGGLQVYSAPGRGSTFKVLFPTAGESC